MRHLFVLLVFAFTSAGCQSQRGELVDPPATAFATMEMLANRLPRMEAQPASVTTRPATDGSEELGEPLFAVTPPYPDAFGYQALRGDDGQTWIYRTGGFAGVREWFGPVSAGDAEAKALFDHAQRLAEREEAAASGS